MSNTTRTYPLHSSFVASFTTMASGAVVRRVDLDLAGGVAVLEISVWRNARQLRPTFQGEVQNAVGGGWTATTWIRSSTGERKIVVGSFADYADAERALVRVRTGKVSSVVWAGPRPVRTHNVRTCGICGHPVAGDAMCRRTALHS
jgi:hypothetical protein